MSGFASVQEMTRAGVSTGLLCSCGAAILPGEEGPEYQDEYRPYCTEPGCRDVFCDHPKRATCDCEIYPFCDCPMPAPVKVGEPYHLCPTCTNREYGEDHNDYD